MLPCSGYVYYLTLLLLNKFLVFELSVYVEYSYKSQQQTLRRQYVYTMHHTPSS